MWQWSEEHQRAEVIAIVSNYIGTPDIPGFLVVEPINPVMRYLEDWRQEDRSDFIITQCRD